MMFQIGRYAQVTAKNLKTTDRYGKIKSFDRMYVTLIMCDNGQFARLLRHNVQVQKTVLFIQKETDTLGTITGNMFTPNLTRGLQNIGRSTYHPIYFKIGEHVRTMYNGKMSIGRVAHINGLEGRVTIDVDGRLVTRELTDILLMRPTDNAALLKARLENVTKVNPVVPVPAIPTVDNACDSAPVLYELTWMWKASPCKRFFYSMNELKTFIKETMDPDEHSDVKYRVMVEKEVKLIPVVTKKSFDI